MDDEEAGAGAADGGVEPAVEVHAHGLGGDVAHVDEDVAPLLTTVGNALGSRIGLIFSLLIDLVTDTINMVDAPQIILSVNSKPIEKCHNLVVYELNIRSCNCSVACREAG